MPLAEDATAVVPAVEDATKVTPVVDQATAGVPPAEDVEAPARAQHSSGEGAVGGRSPWNRVVVSEVRMDLPAGNPVVVMHESQPPWRELAIPVALAEGNYIAYAFKGVKVPRPLTHDLLLDIVGRYGVSIEAGRITGISHGIFLAELEVMGANGRSVVPCRPSDAIAISLRQPVPMPILVAEWVFVAARGSR